MRIVNLFAGPGTGKSTTAAALFAELKYRGVNCELITEYAKDVTWERRGPKVFEAQEYVFAKQHFRMARVADEVDVMITDSPVLMGLVYIPINFYLPSLPKVMREAHDRYRSLNILLKRNKPYNPKGRSQTEDEAKVKDAEIKAMLIEQQVPFIEELATRHAPFAIIEMMHRTWPELANLVRTD